MKSSFARVLLVLLLCLGSTVQADLWTNQAGKVLEGTLGEFDGVSVTLVRTNGSILKLPLTALSPTDQQRVRMQKHQSIAPDFVKAAYRDATVPLERFGRLPAQQQTAEARAKAAQMAVLVFDTRLKARSAELTNQAVLEEVKRLRSLLDKSYK